MKNILRTTYKQSIKLENIGNYHAFVNFTFINVYNNRIGYDKSDRYKSRWIKKLK